MIGQSISHYKILEKLGEGGMGVVYKAHDAKLNRIVALKFLPHGLESPEPERARFLREAQAAAALNHPNICTIHDIASDGDEQFIVMEYVDGKTLRALSQSTVKDQQSTIGLAIQIGEALHEAHMHGIVHRDVKSENIMVNVQNQVKVMDFGLAKLKGSLKLTKTSSTAGTLAYMSPEQIQGGAVDARSDIFSFGVVLYEMLTGHMPFRGEHEAAMVYSIVNEDPTPIKKYLPDVSSELDHVLKRALEKDPEDRYQNVHDMVIDLRRLKKETSRVHRSDFSEARGESRPRVFRISQQWMRRGAMGAGILFLLVLAYLLGWPLVRSLVSSGERIPVAIITFENQTGDPQYDYLRAAIPNLLTTSLEQSTALRVTTWERMRDLLKQLGKADVQVITTDLGFELCQQDSVKALVTGSFVKMGDMFATDVKVIDVESKALLKSASSKGEGVGSILKVQIDELGKQISTGFGLPERTVKSEQKPIVEVTTSSLEAYDLYLKGVREVENLAFQDGRRILEHALRFDSTFAMAHLWLGFACSYLGDDAAQVAAFKQAFRFSARATRRERLFIESFHARTVEADSGKQYRLLKQLEKEFPKEKMVHLVLGMQFKKEDAVARFQQALALDPNYGLAMLLLGYEHMKRGDYEQSLTWLKRYSAAAPGEPNPFDSMGDLYVAMGNLDEARVNYRKALALKPDFLSTHAKLAYTHALREEYVEAMEWITKMRLEVRDAGAQFNALVWQAVYEHWLGRDARALATLTTALKTANKEENRARVGMAQRVLGFVLSSRGEYRDSRRAFAEARDAYTAAYPARASYYTAFYGLLSARDDLYDGRAGAVENALLSASTTLQQLTGENQRWLSLLSYQVRGELLVAKGKTDEAILHWESRPDLTLNPSFEIQTMISLNLAFPRDGRAKALIKKGELDASITEYERLTRFDPSEKERLLIHPLHRYELAKLYEQKGSKQQAVEQYQKFLFLWKNADRERSEVRDARVRIARLAVDDSGNVAISYFNATTNMIRCARLRNGVWARSDVASVQGQYVTKGYNAIALKGDGSPVIAFHRADVSYFVTSWTGSAWATPTPIGWTESAWAFLGTHSVAVNKSTGAIYTTTSFYDSRVGSVLGFCTYPAAQATALDGPYGSNTGHNSSIAVASSGDLHVAFEYQNGSGTPALLKYMKRTGTTWSSSIVDTVGDGGNFSTSLTSIAVDPAGTPHIAYYRLNNGYRYAHWNGASWDISLIDAYGSVGWNDLPGASKSVLQPAAL